MKPISKAILWVVVFAISMGFLESAVVIYLRKIYYENGFQFPLKPIEFSIARVEFFREIATIFMLIGIAYVSGKTKLQRFAFFNLAFAVWDIFYYIFLYVFLGWPESPSTWDILFLVPLPWVGPVWAPCLLSLLMIIGSIFIIQQVNKNPDFKIRTLHWIFLISGAFICILAFMWDYILYTMNKPVWSPFSKNSLFVEITDYIPQTFNHPLFFLGFFMMCYSVFAAMLHVIRKS